MTTPTDAPEPTLTWNAEEVLKLINRKYTVVIFQDGLGTITALAIPKGTGLDAGVQAWRDYPGPNDKATCTLADCQRAIFSGPDKFSGCGFTIAEALHCLAEKAVFGRLPDGHGGYYYPPGKDPK